MLTLKNNTGSFSKVGAVVMQDPKSKDAFVYATKGSTKVLGVVIESVPYRALCKIATQGETAKVLTVGNIVKGNTIRLGKATDNISLGLATIAKSGDSPYLKIGDALNSGRGLVSCVLELAYQGNEEEGYVPYSGATEDLNMGVHDITANAVYANVPYMMQSDSTDQAIADVTKAQVVTFDTDVYHSGITRTSASRFTIPQAGAYLICFSGIASGATGKIIEVWLRVNGSDIPASNTIYTFKGVGLTTIIAMSFIQVFTAGQYFEFWTWGDAITSKWDSTAAGVTPIRPACPCIIMTCNKISI